jgi:hypothetical protein
MRQPLTSLGDAHIPSMLESLRAARREVCRGFAGTPFGSDAYILLTRCTTAMDRVAELVTGDMDALKTLNISPSATQTGSARR